MVENYIKNRLEYLVEEIDSNDRFRRLGPQQKLALEEIKHLIHSTEVEITTLASHYLKLSELFEGQPKNTYNLIELLLTSNINSQIINIDHDIEVYINSHKDLFIILIKEIINFSKYNIDLTEVICDVHKLSFHFKQKDDSLVTGYNEQYAICKLWGGLNNIAITLVNKQNEFIINCSLQNCMSKMSDRTL